MDFWNAFASLFSNFGNLTWQMVVMWGIGALLIYLAIAKKMEPSLLLPMGFGAILVNLPLSGAITQGDTVGPISALFEAGMSNELFPLLLFIGIGAMIDFGPLLEKPWLMLFGAAAQFGIFFTLFLAGFFFDLKDAASIAVIGAADGPTAIFVANVLHSQYLGAIMVAAYSYMALVPIVQPPVIKLLTTQKERRIRMPYQKGSVSQLTKILFPIVVTIIAGLVAPASVALVGFLMFGNLIRECGVLNRLSETAQNDLANLITLLLGITVATKMQAELFLTYPNGAHGHFLASAHECPGTNLLEVCMTRGRVSIRNDSEVEVLQLEEDERVFARTCPSSFGKVPGTAKTLTFDHSDNKVQQAATIENFARAVRSETDIQCSLEEGLRSLQIIHGAYLSHWLERTVPLPPPEDLFRSHLAQLS